jgi:hypothetical protein
VLHSTRQYEYDAVNPAVQQLKRELLTPGVVRVSLTGLANPVSHRMSWHLKTIVSEPDPPQKESS